MAEKELEVESVDAQAAGIDSNANVDAEALQQAEAEANKTVAATQTAAPKVSAPAPEKPKTTKEKSDELFNRVLMGRDKDINNLLNKWGRDKFHKLITENPKFREDFYKDISGRGIQISSDEYKGYYTPTYEQQQDVVYSEEGVKQAREQEQQVQKAARQKAAEDLQAKNAPWYRALPDVVSDLGKQLGSAVKQLTMGATELAQKSTVAKALKIDKAFDYLTDVTTNTQRGSAFGEAVNETDIPRLAIGSQSFDFERIAKQMKDVKSYGATNVEKDFENHEGAWDTFSDWAKIIAPSVIESFATLGRSGWEETLASGVAGAPEVGALMAAYHMELFATIVDELEQAKYDVTNGEDWRKAFANRAFIEPVLKKANTRAAVITGVDFIAAGGLGNVGNQVGKLAKKVEKYAPKDLTSTIAKGISYAAKSKKILDYAPVKAISNKILQTSQKVMQSSAGPKIAKAKTAATTFFNPQESIGAGVGEVGAQYLTTEQVDAESAALEIAPEFGYIKVLGKLLRRRKGLAGDSDIPTAAPADAVTPPAVAPSATDVYSPVTEEEYQAYKKDKKLDPERRAGIEDDAKKALQDPEYLASLQKDAETDEAQKRYLEMVTDSMDELTKLQESTTIMNAAIASVSEIYGGIGEDEMANLIDPASPKFNKDLANAVERKYTELMDAYADETGDESFRQTPKPAAPTETAQTPAETAAQETPEQIKQRYTGIIQNATEIYQKTVDAIDSLEDTPENAEKLKQLRDLQQRASNTLNSSYNKLFEAGFSYDKENNTWVSGQVGVGQEPQQAQPEQGGGTQEAGGSGVLQTPGQEVAAIADDARAIAAQELDVKKLAQEGKIKYVNRKPVYNGKQYKSTKELTEYLKTDEAILEAAESNEAIANALGKTATFAPTTTTGVGQETTTGVPGAATEPVVGAQTAEGTTEAVTVEPSPKESEGKEVQPQTPVAKEEGKEIKAKKQYVKRLQKMLDSGKDEKGNPINTRQKKEAQKTIDRLNAEIAEKEKPVAAFAGKETGKPEGKPDSVKKNNSHLMVSSDVKTALEKGRKKQVLSQDKDGNTIVVEEEFNKEDAEIELDRLEVLAEKGRLTPEEFQKSYFGQSTDTVTLKQAKERILDDAKGFIADLKKSFEGTQKEQKPVETKPETVKETGKTEGKPEPKTETKKPIGKAEPTPKDVVGDKIKQIAEKFKSIESELQGKIDLKEFAERVRKRYEEIKTQYGEAKANEVLDSENKRADKIIKESKDAILNKLKAEYFKKNGIAPSTIRDFKKGIESGEYLVDDLPLYKNAVDAGVVKAKTETKPAVETETTTEETAKEAQPEVEQYVPLTSKDLEIGKFSKEEALEYETDEKELESGRMSEYISSMTVEVLNEDGDTVGFLTKLKDKDNIVTWQSSNQMGDELGIDEAFDTKQEAIQALLDDYNKEQSKEFAKEQKRTAKEAEKKAAKEQKKEAPVEAEKTNEEKIADLRAKEQAEYDSMSDPNDKAKRKEIYDRYDKLISPLIKDKKESTESKVIESTAESIADDQMKMIDSIIETERTKPAAAKEMREQFIQQYGKDVFDKLNKITRNFEQIIQNLEKEGKCSKKC